MATGGCLFLHSNTDQYHKLNSWGCIWRDIFFMLLPATQGMLLIPEILGWRKIERQTLASSFS